MAVIVVTRLRSKDHSCLDDLFTAAVAFLGQAQGSPGILGADEARSSPSPVEECWTARVPTVVAAPLRRPTAPTG